MKLLKLLNILKKLFGFKTTSDVVEKVEEVKEKVSEVKEEIKEKVVEIKNNLIIVTPSSRTCRRFPPFPS